MAIHAQPLEAEHFRPFGEVHVAVRPQAERVETCWFPERYDHDRPLNIAYGVKAASVFPLHISYLERHRLSSQLFVPVRLSRLLVVVCPSVADGSPNLSALTAFTANPSQAVRYDRDIWHAPLHVADSAASYLVVRNCRAMDDDVEVFPLPQPIEIAID